MGAARSREVTAAQIPNPDLTLQSEYMRGMTLILGCIGVSLNWLLRSPEQRRSEIEIAGVDTGNARLQLMDQAWSVRRELAAALSEWESGRRRLNLLSRLAAAQDRLLALEKQRVAAGEDSPGELVSSQQARIQIERQVAEYARKRRCGSSRRRQSARIASASLGRHDAGLAGLG